jgi:hypothetical protein
MSDMLKRALNARVSDAAADAARPGAILSARLHVSVLLKREI